MTVSACRATARRAAFTLVELLVVIAIIGILVALLLPAVQAAREAARRTQCINHLKNLTLGMINHESATQRLPSSGWFGSWTGDPDRGTGPKQPGSWFYSILPFIEQQPLFDMGDGLTGANRLLAYTQRDATTLSVANCPSRRNGGPYPKTGAGDPISGTGDGRVSTYQAPFRARSDYAINVGSETNFDGICQNTSPRDYGPLPAAWPPPIKSFSGISYCGTAVKFKQITDGLTKTIALGERWVEPRVYNDGTHSEADDWSLYTGFQDDTVRSTYFNGIDQSHLPANDSENVSQRRVSTPSVPNSEVIREIFGSAHSGICLFSKCDGSVDTVNIDIDAQSFRKLGHRADGDRDVTIQR